MSKKKGEWIALTAGGTGGHVFPAQAVAEKLVERGYRVMFVTDKRTRAKFPPSESGARVFSVAAASPSGSAMQKIKALILLSLGLVQAMRYFLCHRPKVVVGFGGYPSFPALVAARILGIPTIVHEQNAYIGRVNKVFCKYSKAIATSFQMLEGLPEKLRHKVKVTGNPVRKDFIAKREVAFQGIAKEETIELLIVGGSLGANIFSALVPDALVSLPTQIRERLHVVQQCRQEDLENVAHIYKNADIEAELDTFFNDMPERMGKAHLVISRAGASTLCEIAVVGRPAIVVPYPYAMDDHQSFNAKAMQEQGALMSFSQETITHTILGKQLEVMFTDGEVLTQLAVNAYDAGVLDADIRLADVIESVIQKRSK